MKKIKCPQCNNLGYVYRMDFRNWFKCPFCGFTLPQSAISKYSKGRPIKITVKKIK